MKTLLFSEKTLAIAATAAFVLIVATPSIEASMDAGNLDRVITETCHNRHGFNLITRWSCRSHLHRMGPVALMLGCAFSPETTNDNTGFCDNVNRSVEASEREVRRR